MNRRQFVSAAAAFTATALSGTGSRGGAPGYRLKAAPAVTRIADTPAGETAVWAYGGTVPGPVIRARKGENLRIEFENGLADPTTVHWHGLRIPNPMDGVPVLTQPPVEPGQAFVYEFAPPDAGTFWYHPHLRSSEQLAHGLYGALIVEEEKPIKVDRDILWMIDDWRLLDDGSINENFSDRHDISHEGRVGNRVTINGRPLKEFPVRVGERLRLRLVNTANARTFGLNFGDLKPLVIALDGQPVTPHPPADNRVVMGSAMRADLIVDVTGEPGEKTTIVDDYYDQTTYDFLTIVRGPEPPLREAGSEALPTLMPNPLPEPDLADAIAQGIVIEGGSKGYLEEAIYKGEKYDARKLWRQHKKIWTLNGVASHGVTMEPMHSLRLGRSYRWQMKNDTAWEHPMHLHGHHFRVLTRNGKPVAHRPWADTVLLQPDEVVEVAFVADNPGNWLFHCHILEHHEGGMGAVVRVA